MGNPNIYYNARVGLGKGKFGCNGHDRFVLMISSMKKTNDFKTISQVPLEKAQQFLTQLALSLTARRFLFGAGSWCCQLASQFKPTSLLFLRIRCDFIFTRIRCDRTAGFTCIDDDNNIITWKPLPSPFSNFLANTTTMTNEHQSQKLFVYRGPNDKIPRDITHMQVEDGTVRVPPNIFAALYELTHVDLPDSLTSLPKEMFFLCKKLKSVNIPSSVKSIGPKCFAYSGITKIVIPDTVREIGEYAFERCYSLTEITFPKNNEMTSISKWICYSCCALTKVHIPSNILRIESNAFRCAGLKSIIIPDSVEYIGEDAFTEMRYIQTVQLPCNEEFWISYSGLFICCPSIFHFPKPEKMSQSQFRCWFLSDINEHLKRQFSFPMSLEDGQRSFDKTIPCKAWPLLFSQRPIQREHHEDSLHAFLLTSQSTFDSLIFLHLKTNMATLLGTTLCVSKTIGKQSH